MLLALTIWENRISPLFDVAQKLMIVEIDENRIIAERIEDFCFKSSVERAHYLKSCHVDVLICGAVSNLPAGMMELSGIRLFPFVTGRVNHIIQSFIRQEFPAASFKMPGCRQRAHKQRRGGCFKNEKIEKEVISMSGGDGKGPQGGGRQDGSGRDDAGNSRGNSGGSDKGSGKGGGKGGCQDGKGSGQGGGKGGGQGGGKGGGQGRGR